MGNILFGDQIREMSTVTNSLYTLMYWTVGDFGAVSFDEMKAATSKVMMCILCISYDHRLVITALGSHVITCAGRCVHHVVLVFYCDGRY